MNPQRTLLVQILFVFLSIPLAHSAITIPASSKDVLYDFAGLLEEPRKAELLSIVDRVEKQTGVEMAVVTIKPEQNQRFSTSQFDQYANNLFNQWGVGHKAINNGVLLLVSPKDRLIRFQFGTDYTADDISRVTEKYDTGVLPHLQTKNYSEGVFAASMLALITATEDVSWWWYHRVALVLFALALIALIGVAWSHKHNVKEGKAVGVVVFLVLVIWGLVKYFPDNRLPGFNGGQTTGVGVTRQWPSA